MRHESRPWDGRSLVSKGSDEVRAALDLVRLARHCSLAVTAKDVVMPSENLPVLLVAAWEPELTRARAVALAEPFRGRVVLDPIGVGLVDAAVGTARLLATHRPALALFVGTCGAFVSAADALPADPEVVVGRGVRLADGAVLAKRAEIPGPMPVELALDSALHDAAVDAGARSVGVVNTVGVTVDDAFASELAALGDVEHLEAFAFARACALHGVRAGVVLGVANAVGSRGRTQWRERHSLASERAGEVVMATIARAFGGRS